MAEKNSEFQGFLDKQESIYDKFRTVNAEMGISQGLEKDPGTEPQGAFLVAWRYPDDKIALVEEFSLGVRDVVAALPYGVDNAHTTISDYGLQPELLIDPNARTDQAETLGLLSNAVKKALDISKRSKISGFGVEFKDMPTNGKTIIAAGIPTEALWQLNRQVLGQGAKLGIELKGSWGNHMTVNRFLEDKPAESQAVADLMRLIREAPALGPVKPVAVDVGYFHTDATGFKFTTADRFEIGKLNF